MSIEKKPNKKWMARVYYTDKGGKYQKISKTFDRKSEAVAWESAKHVEKRHGANFAKSKTIFSDYFKHYVELYKSGGSPFTKKIWLGTYNKLQEEFAGRKIQSLTKDDLQLYLNNYAKDHAITTVQKIYQHIHVVIQAAIDDGIIHRDIAKDLVVSGLDPKAADAKFLEYDDYITLLHYLVQHVSFKNMSYELMLFSLMSGCRWGECIGLTWDDVDFKKATVSINKQWFPKRDDFGKTKGNGKSDRTISLPKDYMPYLKQLKQDQRQYFDNLKLENKQDQVFLNSDLEILRNDSVNDALTKLCNDLGIKHITFHGIRHTHASRLIYDQLSDWYIAKRLGHGSLEELHRTYGHLFQQMRSESDSEVSNALSKDLKLDSAKQNIVGLKNHKKIL